MRIKLIIAFLCCIFTTASAKNNAREVFSASRNYLSIKYKSSAQSSREIDFAQAFAKEFCNSDKNITYKIRILENGKVMFNEKTMSLKQAKQDIKSSSHIFPKAIVFFIMSGEGRKARKSFNQLTEEMNNLIKERENKGINYQSYPVLCNELSSVKNIVENISKNEMDQTLTALKSTISHTEETELPQPKTNTETMAVENHSAKASRPISNNKQSQANSHEHKEHVSTANTRLYLVHVNSSLNIREQPYANSKRIGSLSNNDEVHVVNIENGWAQIIYGDRYAYVSASHLTPKSLPQIDKSVHLDFLNGSIYEGIYRFIPYIVLILGIILIFANGNAAFVLTFLIGLFELIFAIAFETFDGNGFPWFCSPQAVGWIMTIVDFFLLLALLMGQYHMYKNVAAEIFPNTFLYILSFPFILATGFVMLAIFKEPLTGILGTVIAILIWWFCIYWGTEDASRSLQLALWILVSFGGAAALLLKTAPVLIIGSIILLFLRAAGEGSKQSSRHTETQTDSSHDEGFLSESGNGVPYITHRDGTTTQLHDSGGGVMRDSDGNIWHHHDNGYYSK